MGMFSSIYGTMEGLITGPVLGGYGAIAGMAASGLRAAIGVYMVVSCYAVLRGIAGEGFGHVLTQGAKASLVLMAVTSGLGGVTAQSVMQWPDQLAVGSGTAGNAGAAADNFVDKVEEAARQVRANALPTDAGSLFDPGPAIKYYLTLAILWLVSIVPIILSYLLAAVMVVMLLFMKFALACTALFGPIFVACILFDSTRGMFFTWLGGALSYAIGTVIIGLVSAVIINSLMPVADALSTAVLGAGVGADKLDAGASALLGIAGVVFVGLFFLLQAQSIAQGIAGGGGGSSAGVAGAIIPSSFTVRAAMGGLSRQTTSVLNAAKAEAGILGRGAKGAGNLARSGARSAASVMRGEGSAATAAAGMKTK